MPMGPVTLNDLVGLDTSLYAGQVVNTAFADRAAQTKILGDLVKSFWKRRVRVAPGRSWFPFDQIDYAVGALAALAPWAFPGWRVAAGIVAVGLALHLASVAVGHAIGVRERWI